MANNELVIYINAQSARFDAVMKRMGEQTEELEGKLSALAKVSGVAFAALTAEIGLSLKAFHSQEQATNELTQALQNQGIYTEKLVGQYRQIADEIQRKTGIDDDAIVKGQALIQGMIGQQTVSKELTQAVVDLAAAKKIDLTSAFDLVAKGINGNVGALSRYGLKIDEHLNQQERMSRIIELVSQKFGGQAEAAGKGLGSFERLKATFSDLQEEIGRRFAPMAEKAINAMTRFFQFIKDSKPLTDLIVSLGTAATVVAGLATAVGVAGVALLKIRALMMAAGVATNFMGIAVKGLVGATGIGLLVVIATELYLNWSTIWPRMQAIFQAFTQNVGKGAEAIGQILSGMVTFDSAKIKAGWDQLKEAFKQGYESAAAEVKPIQEPAIVQDPRRKELADQEEADRKAREQRRQESLAAHQELVRLQSENHSQELLALAKQEADLLTQIEDEKNAAIRDNLQAKLEETRMLKEEAFAVEMEQNVVMNDEILAQNEEFQALSDEQKAIFKAKNMQALQDQILTEDTARQKAAKDRATQQIAANNQFLLDQQKFGTAYAAINKAMHSEIYQGTKSAFGNMEQLTQSHNATLKGIGKVAAIANIIIKTAESAMNVYAGFSTIPIIGPSLGLAAAAAAIAFGAEQVGRVTAAADGGILTGGIPGRDSIPVLGMPGELIVPTRNFDEVVNAVAARRTEGQAVASISGQESAQVQQQAEMLQTLKDIDAKLQQPSMTVIQGDVLADDIFIDALVRKISDAVEYRNAQLITSPIGS